MFFTRLLRANQMPIFLFQFLKAFLMCIPLKNSLVMLDCVHFYLRSTGAKLHIAVIMSTFLYILPILLSLFKNAQWCDVQPSCGCVARSLVFLGISCRYVLNGRTEIHARPQQAGDRGSSPRNRLASGQGVDRTGPAPAGGTPGLRAVRVQEQDHPAQ